MTPQTTGCPLPGSPSIKLVLEVFLVTCPSQDSEGSPVTSRLTYYVQIEIQLRIADYKLQTIYIKHIT